MSCLDTVKTLARAEVAMLYSRLFLDRIEKGTSKASAADVSAGIITAAGLLGSPLVDNPLRERFIKLSKSIKPVVSEIKKSKQLSKKSAAQYRKKMDRLIKKTELLWDDVKKQACDSK